VKHQTDRQDAVRCAPTNLGAHSSQIIMHNNSLSSNRYRGYNYSNV